MIWLRRAIAVPVGMLLLPALTALLMFQGVHSTLLSPDFHASELRRAGVYEFALDDLLTVALDEAREIETGPVTASIGGQDRELLKENPLIASGLSSEDIAASVRRVATPEWVQGVVEQWLEQHGRYLTGERDDFDVAIGLDEQSLVLIEEVKLLLRKADAGGLLFEALVEPEMERAAVAYVPFGLDVSAERLTESARRVAGPDWIQVQIDAVFDEVAPYLVGDRDTFEVHVDLAGRAEVALEEVKALLREADAYEVLYTNVVEPRVEEALGGAVALGFGIEVTDGEVTAALRRVAPPEWVQQQAERVLDGATFYLTGREESFAVAVSIEGNKREAAAVIEEAVGRRFDEALAALPKCTGTHVSQVLTSLELPTCIPEGTPDAVVSAARSSVVGGVQLLLLTPIPDSVTFTDRHLRAAVEEVGAAEEAELIDSVREVLRDGWVYTQDDLRRDLAGLGGEGQGEAGVDPATLLDDVPDGPERWMDVQRIGLPGVGIGRGRCTGARRRGHGAGSHQAGPRLPAAWMGPRGPAGDRRRIPGRQGLGGPRGVGFRSPARGGRPCLSTIRARIPSVRQVRDGPQGRADRVPRGGQGPDTHRDRPRRGRLPPNGEPCRPQGIRRSRIDGGRLRLPRRLHSPQPRHCRARSDGGGRPPARRQAAAAEALAESPVIRRLPSSHGRTGAIGRLYAAARRTYHIRIPAWIWQKTERGLAVAAASDLKREIPVNGMTCASCAQQVTAALEDVPGVGGCARRMVR